MPIITQSQNDFEQARKLLPGGVNSPVRAFKSVGGTPRFFARAAGSHVWDVDGNEYIDYVGSWGPMILGHTHPAVVKGVQETAELGMSFGAQPSSRVLGCGIFISIRHKRHDATTLSPGW